MNRGLLKTRIGSLVLSIAFCALLLTGCGCTINRRNVGMNNTGPPCITGSIVENGGHYLMPAKLSFLSASNQEISVEIGGELSGSAEISYLELFADIPLEIGTVICYDGEEAEVTEYDEDLEFYSLRVITGGKFYSQQGNTINVYIKLNLIVTLTATVEPKNATNQEVDWSVQWSENAALKNNAVTDYVTVTPISDGNRTAKVTLKRAFGSDTILIIVTTRDGGFTAQCSATFKGAPIRVTGVTLDDTLEF